VLAGVALTNLGETGQAEQAYRKAIEEDANNPLAWKVSFLVFFFSFSSSLKQDTHTHAQGLSELYSKTTQNDKLPDVYKKLIELST
jgi:tetratricopeptide (TPR) repeat protein